MYDSKQKARWDNQAVLDYAIQEGKAKGMAEGKAEGKRENALEVALKLKKMGLPLADISKATDLSIEEIEKL